MPATAKLTEQQRAERRHADRQFAQQAVTALQSSEGWQAWLSTRRHFHRYSLANQLLIAMQRMGSRCVLGRGGVDIRSSGSDKARGYGESRSPVGLIAGFVALVGLFVTDPGVGVGAGLAA